MPKSALIIISLILLVFCLDGQSVDAQADAQKFEVGGLFTTISLNNFSSRSSTTGNGSAQVNGLGGRLGYNFTKYLALEGEASFFPETHFGNDQLGQKTQAFIGLKAGTRSRRFGLFAKARPGVMFIGEVTTSLSCSSGGSFTECRPNHNTFAFDAGAVVEFYPSRRAIVRLDLGDTIIRLKQNTGGTFFGPPQTSGGTTNNFQVSLGFSYRF